MIIGGSVLDPSLMLSQAQEFIKCLADDIYNKIVEYRKGNIDYSELYDYLGTLHCERTAPLVDILKEEYEITIAYWDYSKYKFIKYKTI